MSNAHWVILFTSVFCRWLFKKKHPFAWLVNIFGSLIGFGLMVDLQQWGLVIGNLISIYQSIDGWLEWKRA